MPLKRERAFDNCLVLLDNLEGGQAGDQFWCSTEVTASGRFGTGEI